MQFPSRRFLAGLVTTSLTCLGGPAFADAYYLESWSVGTSIAGVPMTGSFLYDATTGSAIPGNNSNLSGFCASGACGFSINATTGVVLSNPSGATVQLVFNDPAFGTVGAHLLSFALNGPQPDGLGPVNGLLPTAGGLTVAPIALFLEQWTADASIAGRPISGGFLYDPATGRVLGNNTSIPGFCASGACGFNINATTGVELSNPSGATVQLVFNDPTFGTVGAHLLSFALNGPQPDGLGPVTGVLSTAGGLNVSPSPSPTPGVGLASLIAFVSAMFGRRRLRATRPD